MKFKDWLNKWNIKLKIKASIFELELNFTDNDKNAAWELYAELITRSVTQPLNDHDGDEETALESIYSIFQLTRTLLKGHGRQCKGFAQIAIPVLNQVIRPFTSKWHKLKLEGAFKDADKCEEFRAELKLLQTNIDNYIKLLADMAGVEELADLEN